MRLIARLAGLTLTLALVATSIAGAQQFGPLPPGQDQAAAPAQAPATDPIASTSRSDGPNGDVADRIAQLIESGNRLGRLAEAAIFRPLAAIPQAGDKRLNLAGDFTVTVGYGHRRVLSIRRREAFGGVEPILFHPYRL